MQKAILPIAFLLAAGTPRLQAQLNSIEHAKVNISHSEITSHYSPSVARDSAKFKALPIIDSRIIVKDNQIVPVKSDTVSIDQIVLGAGNFESRLGTAVRPNDPLSAGTKLSWDSYTLEITEMLPQFYAVNGDRIERAVGNLEIRFQQGSYNVPNQVFVLNSKHDEIEVMLMPKLNGWLSRLGADSWIMQHHLLVMPPFSGNPNEFANWMKMAQDSILAYGGLPANHFALELARAGDNLLLVLNATAFVNGARADTSANGIAIAIAGTEAKFADGTTGTQRISLPTRAKFTDASGNSVLDEAVFRLGTDTTFAITVYDPTSAQIISPAIGFEISSVYPNPASRGRHVNVDINMRAGSSLRVEIYDLMGRRVLALPQADMPSANVTATLNVGSLPSGHYTIMAISGEQYSSQALTIAK